MRTEFARKTFHPSAASTATNNNTVLVIHGFSNFCQEMVFTAHWPVKKAKYWFRVTLDTVCSSKHKQSRIFGLADCCSSMRNQELPSCPEHKTGRDPDFLSSTAYFNREKQDLCPGHIRDNVTNLPAVTHLSYSSLVTAFCPKVHSLISFSKMFINIDFDKTQGFWRYSHHIFLVCVFW